jgi:hypothetical protein
MNATRLTEPIAFTVTRKGRARARRSRFVRIEPTDKGRAAAAYLQALDTYIEGCRTLYDENFEPTPAYYDAAAAIARVTALESAADAYRAFDGFICEDCNQLEKCLCPNV